jgi:hypothetical protein
MSTSRTDFVETWLMEAPEGLGNMETFDQVRYNIQDLKLHQIPVQDLSAGLKKTELSQTLYYWFEISGEIILGTELDRRSQGLVVRLTGKDPALRGKPPFASDLYISVLNDNQDKSLRILSDNQLSDEGYKIWKRLFAQGAQVSVYDKNNPGKSFRTFQDFSEFDKYFQHDNSDYKSSQYVLSSNSASLAETRGFFHIRRYRELTGLSCED